MRDSAVVISVKDGFARVKVAPRVSCCDCSARSLCAGIRDDQNRLEALNPVGARPGDEVEIDVPETNYHRDLIRIFGLLLLAALAGLALGSALRPFGGLSAAANGLAGLLAGVVLSGFGLYRFFRARESRAGYPEITQIIGEGEHHGQKRFS